MSVREFAPEVATVLGVLTGVTGQGPWKARCPCHDDAVPSLALGVRNGKLLWRCHAGCTQDDVTRAIKHLVDTGGPSRALSSSSGAAQPKKTRVATYTYTDSTGKPVFYRDRLEWFEHGTIQKTVLPRRLDGAVRGLAPVPYNLHGITRASADGQIVIVCEGEKAADALNAAGFAATTTGSSTSWRSTFAQHFAKSRTVVLWPDADAAGESYIRAVAADLSPMVSDLRVLRFPDKPSGWDAFDFFATGGTADQLVSFMASAPSFVQSSRPDADRASSTPPGHRTRETPRTLEEWLKNPALLAPLVALIEFIAYVGRSSLLAAREKTGKSTLLAQAVTALTAGRAFLGSSLMPKTVLWYCIDEAIADCIRRFQEMGADPQRLFVSTERPTAAEMVAEASACGADLVVVDTLSELWRGKIRSEKDADETSAFLDPYVRGMREIGVALVFSHHTPKNGGGYRGSGAIGAKLDVLLDMRRLSRGNAAEEVNELEEDIEVDDGRRILEGRGRGVPHFVHRLSFDGSCYSLGEKPLPLRERVLAAIPLTGATTRAIRERVRGKNAVIADVLKVLEEDAVIRRDGVRWMRSQAAELGGSPGGGSRRDLPSEGEPASGTAPSDGAGRGTAREPGWHRSGTANLTQSTQVVPGISPRENEREPLGESEVLL